MYEILVLLADGETNILKTTLTSIIQIKAIYSLQLCTMCICYINYIAMRTITSYSSLVKLTHFQSHLGSKLSSSVHTVVAVLNTVNNQHTGIARIFD